MKLDAEDIDEKVKSKRKRELPEVKGKDMGIIFNLNPSLIRTSY